MTGASGMTMDRLLGEDVYLRLETNTDFVEAEEGDGRVCVKVTGIDPVGLWVLSRRYPVKLDADITMVAAQVLIPFRNIQSIAMVDANAALDEAPQATSLEEAMASEGGSKDDLEKMAAKKIPASRQSFRFAKLTGANLAGIIMRETDLEQADLRDACLAGADLKDAQLREVNAEGADFTGAFLWEALLEGSNLVGATFKGANMLYANLKGCNLARADLEGANLVETNLTDARLTGARLEGVKLLRSNLSKVTASDVEYKALGNALRKEGKEYHQTGYFSEARWCLEKAIVFYRQAKDDIAAAETKNFLEDVEDEEKLSAASQRDR